MENIQKQVLGFLLNDYLSTDKDRKTIELFLAEQGLLPDDIKPAAYYIRTSSPDVFAVGRKICETVIRYPERKIWEVARGDK